MIYGEECWVAQYKDTEWYKRIFIDHLPDGKILCVKTEETLKSYTENPRRYGVIWEQGKPVEKLVPYNYEQLIELRGQWVRRKGYSAAVPISAISLETVRIDKSEFTFKEFLKYFDWIDDTHCGVKE